MPQKPTARAKGARTIHTCMHTMQHGHLAIEAMQGVHEWQPLLVSFPLFYRLENEPHAVRALLLLYVGVKPLTCRVFKDWQAPTTNTIFAKGKFDVYSSWYCYCLSLGKKLAHPLREPVVHTESRSSGNNDHNSIYAARPRYLRC
jgi:hypothetical protein